MLALMERNAHLNGLEHDKVRASVFNWGEERPEVVPAHPDVILAADCVYFEPAFPLLLQTLRELIGHTTVCFFCFKKRRRADMHFMKAARKVFVVQDVEDDPDRDVYKRENITLPRERGIPRLSAEATQVLRSRVDGFLSSDAVYRRGDAGTLASLRDSVLHLKDGNRRVHTVVGGGVRAAWGSRRRDDARLQMVAAVRRQFDGSEVGAEGADTDVCKVKVLEVVGGGVGKTPNRHYALQWGGGHCLVMVGGDEPSGSSSDIVISGATTVTISLFSCCCPSSSSGQKSRLVARRCSRSHPTFGAQLPLDSESHSLTTPGIILQQCPLCSWTLHHCQILINSFSYATATVLFTHSPDASLIILESSFLNGSSHLCYINSTVTSEPSASRSHIPLRCLLIASAPRAARTNSDDFMASRPRPQTFNKRNLTATNPRMIRRHGTANSCSSTISNDSISKLPPCDRSSDRKIEAMMMPVPQDARASRCLRLSHPRIYSNIIEGMKVSQGCRDWRSFAVFHADDVDETCSAEEVARKRASDYERKARQLNSFSSRDDSFGVDMIG
nr:protein-lysine n-methyltransferase efm6 [Quercus suber]